MQPAVDENADLTQTTAATKNNIKNSKRGRENGLAGNERRGQGHRALLGKIVMIYYEIQWPMTKTGVEQMK